MTDAQLAQQAKSRGNGHFSKKEWDLAIKEYSEAIDLDPTQHAFYSNRSACFAGKQQYSRALTDAEKCVELKPDWPKGYSRKGLALFKLGRLSDAEACYTEGLKYDANNASLKEGLEQTQQEKERQKSGGPGVGGPGGLFGPDMYMKIQSDPELREYAKDPAFMQKVNMLMSNPQQAMQIGLLNDPRIQKLFEIMLGMKLGTAPTGDMAEEPEVSEATDQPADEQVSEPMDTTPDQKEEPVISEEKKEDAEKLKRENEALEWKTKGNELYSEKKLDEALEAYKKAQELDPNKPAYLLNQSAVLFMQKKWKDCLSICEETIKLCRAKYLDLKWTFKAYKRMGSVFEEQGEFSQAIQFYKKALIEKNDRQLKKKVQTLQHKKKKAEDTAYLDPEKAQEHKTKGNEFFKQGKWQDAIQEYSESIRRNPNDARVYSNRATAYCKLMAWELALKDCNKASELDPNFVKPHIRQGLIHHALKQYHKALKSYRKAAALDPNNGDLITAQQKTMYAIQMRNASGEVDELARKRALDDPEVQATMNDPEVSNVLMQARNDPTVVQKAMRDPNIREKMEFLLAAGVLQMR